MTRMNWSKATSRSRMASHFVEQHDDPGPFGWLPARRSQQPKQTGPRVKCLSCGHRGRVPVGVPLSRLKCSACGHRQGTKI